MKEVLTSSQQSVYDFFVSFSRKYGFAPTVRDVQREFKYKSPTTAAVHLRALRRKNYIAGTNSNGARARTLRVVDDILAGGTPIGRTITSNDLKLAVMHLGNDGRIISYELAYSLLVELGFTIIDR
jgi:repressor LexA